MTPKISDFGLAKRLDEDEGQTVTGQILGTPSYMAPEQAEGRISDIGPLTDVYALGAILYECLTGTPPFRGLTKLDTLEMVRSQEPIPPMRLNPKVPRDLETICLKCLQKEPRRRYADAHELAEDLRRFQEGRPIHARPISIFGWLRKWVARHPAISALLGTLAAVVMVGFVVIWLQLRETRNALAGEKVAKKEAQENERKAQNNERKAQDNERKAQESDEVSKETTYFRTVALGFREWEDNQMVQVADRLTRMPPERRQWEYHLLDRLCHKEQAVVYPHQSPFNSVAVSPDGKWIAGGNWDDIVIVWDAETGKIVHRLLGHTNSVLSVAFSPDGKWLVSGGGADVKTGEYRIWDIQRGFHEFVGKISTGVVLSVAYSPDGKTIAIGTNGRHIHLIDAETGKERKSFPSLASGTMSLRYGQDSKLLAATGSSNCVTIWDISKGEMHSSYYIPDSSGMFALDYRPDGKQLVTTGYQDRDVKVSRGAVWLWNITEPTQEFQRTPAKTVTVEEGPGPQNNPIQMIRSTTYNADGTRLALGTYAGRVIVCNAEGTELQRWDTHDDIVASVRFHPTRDEIISTGWDGEIVIRDLGTGKIRQRMETLYVPALSMTFSPDGKYYATGGARANSRGEFSVRETDTHRLVYMRTSHSSSILAVAWSSDGQWIASGGADRQVIVWEAATGKVVRTFTKHTTTVRGVAFSADGQRVASLADDGTLLIWNRMDGAVLKTKKGENFSMGALAYQPKGTLVAYTTSHAGVQVWDSESEKLLAQLNAGSESINNLAWSQDGKTLVLGGTRRIYFWDAEKKAVTGELIDGMGGEGLAISNDGKKVIRGGKDLRLWDRDTKEVHLYRGHTRNISVVAFHPDNQRFASASEDRSLRFWEVDQSRPFAKLANSLRSEPLWDSSGRYLVIGTNNNREVQLFDATLGKVVHTFKGHQYSIHRMTILEEPTRIVSAAPIITPGKSGETVTTQFECKVWDVEKRKELHSRVVQGTCLGFDHEGKQLIVSPKPGESLLYDPISGETSSAKAAVPTPEGTRRSYLSPDGKRMACLGSYFLAVVERETGRELYRIREFRSPVSRVSWSPDGQMLLTCTSGVFQTTSIVGQLRLWRASDGAKIREFRGHNAGIGSAIFHPSGKRIVSAGHDGTVKLWDVESGEEVLSLRIMGGHLSFDRLGNRLAITTPSNVEIWDGTPRK